jgi:hypothetical protein
MINLTVVQQSDLLCINTSPSKLIQNKAHTPWLGVRCTRAAVLRGSKTHKAWLQPEGRHAKQS